MRDYTEYTPDERNQAEMRECGIPLKGDLVVSRMNLWYGQPVSEGAIGVVTASGVSNTAYEQFALNEAVAVAQDRPLRSDDYECLVDSEGPVVLWPGGHTDWFPGQSMAAIRRLDRFPDEDDFQAVADRWLSMFDKIEEKKQ